MRTSRGVKMKSLSERASELILSCQAQDISKLTVNEIARQMGVNASYLSRTFKSEKKITLKESLMQHEISMSALILIQNSKLRVKEVAALFNFCSCSYYIKVFKALMGTSPAKYRGSFHSFHK
jgi:YesN/AraC family two-component response regulator